MDPLSRRVRELPLVFLDFETTGLRADEGDEILELGAVKVVGGEETGQLDSLVRPSKPIPPESARIHGITDLFVMGAPTFDLAADLLLAFVDGAVILAHNAPFDASFLTLGLQKVGKKVPDNLVLDTVVLARSVLPGLPNHKLETLKKHFDVRADRSHRALDDSRALSRVFAGMVEAHFHGLDGGPTLGDIASRSGAVYHLSDFTGGLPLKTAEHRALVRWAMREKAELLISHLAVGRLLPEEVRAVPLKATPGNEPSLVVQIKAKGTEATIPFGRMKTIRRAL